MKTQGPTASRRYRKKEITMITLHKLNGQEFILNAMHIEQIEEKPDTTITLTNDRKFIVLEKKDEVVQKAIEFFRISANPGILTR
jgi:flagellar protein FlbD